MTTYRQMNADDIPAGLALCRAAGWNQLKRDWELFLLVSPEGCRVAQDENGKVIGTVTTVRYEDHFSWVGMVLVDPPNRKKGIGRQLLNEALHILQNAGAIKLDATPAGREVYLKLEFVDEYSISRMQAMTTPAIEQPLTHAQPVLQEDLVILSRLDRSVFGADRFSVLEWILTGAPQYAFVAKGQAGVDGYCFGRTGHNFTHIGPVIANDIESAKTVFAAALQNCSGPVITDALHQSTDWIRWLLSLGFVEQRKLTRMHRGTNTWPGIPEKQFSILGPEFG